MVDVDLEAEENHVFQIQMGYTSNAELFGFGNREFCLDTNKVLGSQDGTE